VYRNWNVALDKELIFFEKQQSGGGHLMQLNVSGHHVEVTYFLESYVLKKVKSLERLFDGIMNMELILSVKKNDKKYH